MKIIIVKDMVKDNEWGTPSEETDLIFHTFSSFEKAKKKCMEDFNRIYHYYDKFKWHYPYYNPHNPYGFYIPSIRKEKMGINILFTIYPPKPSFQEVVGDEKEPVLQVQYRLINVNELPCD